jgi:hypothetical protein
VKRDKRPSLRVILRHFQACADSRRWVGRKAREGATVADMWNACPCGSWLIFLVDTAFDGEGPEATAAEAAWTAVMDCTSREDADRIRRAITWPVVERALLDRYLRETGSVSS